MDPAQRNRIRDARRVREHLPHGDVRAVRLPVDVSIERPVERDASGADELEDRRRRDRFAHRVRHQRRLRGHRPTGRQIGEAAGVFEHGALGTDDQVLQTWRLRGERVQPGANVGVVCHVGTGSLRCGVRMTPGVVFTSCAKSPAAISSRRRRPLPGPWRTRRGLRWRRRRPRGLPTRGCPGRPTRRFPTIRFEPYATPAVALTDTFWQPKVATNATVTIPFEVQKLTESGRTLSGNVLEAAILSLEAHPDPALQAQVDAAVQAMLARSGGGNNGFEVAAAYFLATGKRDLVDRAITAADALYEDFRVNDPPFSGRRARRDQLRPALSRHARQEASGPGEALPRHSRARELGQSQPAQPVVQARPRAERGRRPRRQLRLAHGVAHRRRRADRPRRLPPGGAAHVDRRGRARRCTSRAASARPATKASARPMPCPTSPRTPRRAPC